MAFSHNIELLCVAWSDKHTSPREMLSKQTASFGSLLTRQTVSPGCNGKLLALQPPLLVSLHFIWVERP